MKFNDMLAKAVKEEKIESLGEVSFRFAQPGDVLLGRYIERTVAGGRKKRNQYYQYHFETDTGKVFCSPGRGFDYYYADKLEIGKIYQIVYTNNKKTRKNNEMKVYSMFLVPEFKHEVK